MGGLERMSRNIYIDAETSKCIQLIQRFNPDFNVSGFVQSRIQEFAGKTAIDNKNVAFMENRVSDLKMQEEGIKEQRSYFEKILNSIKKEVDHNTQSKNNEKEIKDKKRVQKIIDISNSIKFFFEIDDSNKIKDLATEFVQAKEKDPEKYPTIFELMKEYGYNPKEE